MRPSGLILNCSIYVVLDGNGIFASSPRRSKKNNRIVAYNSRSGSGNGDHLDSRTLDRGTGNRSRVGRTASLQETSRRLRSIGHACDWIQAAAAVALLASSLEFQTRCLIRLIGDRLQPLGA